jgi:hypothetical protein
MAGRIAYLGNIVTQGLVLDLDAAIQGSYPKTGTLWTDISGNNNNGTLTNGPAYTGSDYGAIVFDGTNEYVGIPNNSSLNPNSGSFTIICWVNTDPTDGGDDWDLWVAKRSAGNNGYYLGANIGLGGARFMLGNDASSRTDTGFISYTPNTWAMFTGVLNRDTNTQTIIRNNFAQTSSVTPAGGTYNNTATLSIGGDLGLGQYYVKGQQSVVLIYTRALSATEITQNFNALRGRYGI